MIEHDFTAESPMPVSAADLFAWHMRPGALERLLPPWEDVQIVEKPALRNGAAVYDGAVVKMRVPVRPLHMQWVAEHRNVRDGVSFQDVQRSGPFALWKHTHSMLPRGPATSTLQDHVHYALPGGRVGDLLGRRAAQRALDRMFAFRQTRTRADLEVQHRFAVQGTRRVLISGASGLIGSQLAPLLTTGGHAVEKLTRSPSAADEIGWNPGQQQIDTARLGGFDGVVHLAGESIVGRWSDAKKQRIRDSRIEGTRLLCETLARQTDKPQVLVCASAIGIYGNRGDTVLTEDNAPGDGFLADVCRDWEAACQPARDAGIRVVNVRVGLVLSPRGGLLGTLLPLFRTGLGGRVGSGQQWMSWIALDDLLDIIYASLFDASLSGPVNATAPQPVTNAQFTKTLGHILGRPTLLPAPKTGLRLALGEAADELALCSTRVHPAQMTERGHPFRFTNLDPALRYMLGYATT